ncbi:hypothetical protein D3C71_2000780 [compost metagenome]
MSGVLGVEREQHHPGFSQCLELIAHVLILRLLPAGDLGVLAFATGLTVFAHGEQVVLAVFPGLAIDVIAPPRVLGDFFLQVGARPAGLVAGCRNQRL